MYKPVILIGNGCRRNPALVEYLCSLGIPVLTTWMAADMVPEDSPVFCGRPGVIGQRAANIIQQKADWVGVFGARLDADQVAHNLEGFAPNADVQVFDVDQAELDKLPAHWWKKKSDLSQGILTIENFDVPPAWLSWCRALYARFRPELEGVDNPDYVDPYRFISLLSDACQPDDVLAIGSSGYAPVTFLHAFKVKKGQRILNVSTIGAMGADIPMAKGACLGSGKRRTICVTGDGGFMLNVQELEKVRQLNLPIKFFVYNNNGYGSIRTMQDNRFGRRVGCDPDSGLTLPPLDLIAKSYGLHYEYCQSLEDAEICNTWDYVSPEIIELNISPAFAPMPKVMSSATLKPDRMEDMTPKLDPAELKEIMDACNG